VPAAVNEAADYSNRRGMLKITGTGYFFGFTVMDKVGENRSHHLLDAFHFASKAELDPFYAKVFSTVGTGADLGSALTVTRKTEFEIVGPIDTAQNPEPAWDTTASASPYIFNCSIRSDYGLGGAFMDGAKVSGLKSMVCANFTGVSLQKDMTSWQRYSAGAWTSTNYAQYISTAPDSIRMNPARLSRHISAINDAFIQEVSVFAIGQGIHHFTDKGGEITVTNSNSSFGGCAALSIGYKPIAFPQDRNWVVGNIRVPLNLGEKTGNIRRVFLGVISAISSTRITLSTPLAIDETSDTVPALLLRDGYTLANGTKVWVENPVGDDWRSDLTSSAWSKNTPNRIAITAALSQAGTNSPVGLDDDGISLAIGKRVYVRRLVDTRSPGERRVSMQLNNTANARLPERNFVVQTDPTRTGGAVTRSLAAGGSEVLAVTSAGVGAQGGPGVIKTAEVTIRRSAPSVNYANNTFYRAGAVVKFAGKHFQSLKNQITVSASPSPLTWGETFVHMLSDYNAEDPLKSEAPILTLDTDTDPNADTETCGINFTSIWTNAGFTREQYRTATDYLGIHAFLVALGFTAAAAHTALLPQAESARNRNPVSVTDFPTAPVGGAANGRGNWAVEFRRPSILRLFGHAWEWAGFLNYSKSIPAAQKDLSPQNKFTYYFTNEAGGRVVPQGSNEDGFNVSPQGLEDIETGATLSVDSIGSSTLDSVQDTSFPNGLTATEITVDSLSITTSVQFPDVSSAKTNALGPVRLADAAKLLSQASIGGNTDAERNNSINQEPDVVTIKALNFWKIQNRVVTARTGVQVIYVNPLTTVPGRDTTNVNDLFVLPPITEAGFDNAANRNAVAVRFLATAVDFANQSFGPSTIVEYRIGPGVYFEKGTITFKTVTRIRAWDFAANTYLNDTEAGGTKPFMGQSSDGKSWQQSSAYFLNPANHPVFLTEPNYDLGNNSAGLSIRPLGLIFEQISTVVGVVWWGTDQTITASAHVPDSFFTNSIAAVSSWRPLAISDPDNALNYFIRSNMNVDGGPDRATIGLRFYWLRNNCIKCSADSTIINTAIGAILPTAATVGGNSANRGLIEVNNVKLELKGLWLVGNVKISSELSGSYRLNTIPSYYISGHANRLISTDASAGVQFGLGLALGGGGAGGFPDYNITYNNIHLVNNSLQYPTTANDAVANNGGWKSIGPAFRSFIGECVYLNTLVRFWSDTLLDIEVNPERTQGVQGKFGNSNTAANINSNNRTKGIALARGFSIISSIEYFLLRKAGSNAANGEPGDSGYPSNPGEIGADVNFDALNMSVTPVQRGVDVNYPTNIANPIKY
jgi:hypothetical protein